VVMRLMAYVSAYELDSWAGTYLAKAELPWLIQRLIRATCQGITSLEMPGGEEVNLSGFDGVLNCSGGNRYVPDGASAWELSTEKGVTSKANDDYQNRTSQTSAAYQRATSFVFATPKRWTRRDGWQKKRDSEDLWREVRGLRSDDLASWLDEAPWVALSFARWALGQPVEDYISLDVMWKEFATLPSGKELGAEFVCAGREQFSKELVRWLRDGQQGATAIRIVGGSHKEVLDFIATSVHSDGEETWRCFASTVFCVNGRGAALCLPESLPRHVIIPLEDAVPHVLCRAQDGRCRVILASVRNRDETATPTPPGVEDDLVLPELRETELVRALVRVGYRPDDALKLCRDNVAGYDSLKRTVSGW